MSKKNLARNIAAGGGIPSGVLIEDKLFAFGSGTSELIPEGAVSLHVVNDSIRDIRFIWGTTELEADAVSLVNGILMKTLTTKHWVIPHDAVWWGFISSTSDVTLNLVWG